MPPPSPHKKRMNGRKLLLAVGPSKAMAWKAEQNREHTTAESAVLYNISMTFWALATQ